MGIEMSCLRISAKSQISFPYEPWLYLYWMSGYLCNRVVSSIKTWHTDIPPIAINTPELFRPVSRSDELRQERTCAV